MEFERNLNFKTECVINYTKDDKNINHTSKRSCKVLKFPSTITLDHILPKILKLNPKEYPSLFLFIIETDDFENFDVANIKEHYFANFDSKRPILLQITSVKGSKAKWIYRKEYENQFVNLDDDHDLSALLRCVTQQEVEDFTKLIEKFIENFSKSKDSSTILRFLCALNVFDELYLTLITLCASKGKKTDILAVLDASFEDDGRILSVDAQNILSYTFTLDDVETSVLIQAIHNPNKEVIDYLISNCTHLIQQLPFAHRIIVSTTAQDLNKFGILNDLIKCSDFPYPNNFDESSVTDKRLLQTITERKEFLNAIRDKDENRVEKFTNENWNLKLVFSTENKSALYVAAESKNFDAYVKLKSLGFKAEEFETHNDITCLSENERKELDKKICSQTQKNVADAKLDHEKTVHILRTRSYIHNRMTSKDVEAEYREKIRNIFDTIYKIPLCSKFLDAASQCEDLKIIFDFESESVENVDLKSGPSSLGTTYPKSKLIFIGAKDSDENPKRAIEGVLIHEIGHYVMRLVYENNEKPYYKNDELTQNEFDKICKTINKWPKIEVTENNDEENPFESSDEEDDEDDEPVDDECNGIISSVYTHYDEVDFHPELIVRPLQILAHYNGDETKTDSLKFKYNQLFDYINKFVAPDLDKFNLRNRECIRKINRTIGVWSKIENKKLQIEKSINNIDELMKKKVFGIVANIPLLALKSVYQIVVKDNLPDTKNIFISSETFENKEILGNIKSVLLKSKDIRIIVDCSKGFKRELKKMFDLDLRQVILVTNVEHIKELEQLLAVKQLESNLSNVNYTNEDLTDESQCFVLNKIVKFQDNHELTLIELLANQKATKELAIDVKQFNNIVDDELLKMLIENSIISINANSEDIVYDKNFDILFQPRNLIRSTGRSSVVDDVLFQDEILTNVKSIKSILISDLGGTGKSWMLKNIAKTLRKQEPMKWVALIDLKQHIQAFKDQNKTLEFSSFMSKILKFNCNFEENIFNLLYKNGRVVFLFDGFDEIPQECADFITSLVKSFRQNGGNQLWITTRNYCENDLQQKIKFDAVFNLQEFTEENGIDLVAYTWLLNETKIFNADLKLHPNYPKYKKMVKKLGAKLTKKIGRPIGYPLFYKMIANVYKNKKDSIDILTLYLIFDDFVTQQCERWMSEKGSVGIKAAVKSQNKSCGFFEIHQLLALISLFPRMRKFCNLDYDKHNWLDKEINTCGLATKNGEISIFQHECFREFFVIQFILSVLTATTKLIDEDFWTILKDILSNNKFVVLRMFLNDALAQGTEDYKKVKKTLSSSQDYFKNIQCEEVLIKNFKESHANLIKLFIELSTKDDYTIVKDVLHKTIKEIIEVAQSNETVVTIFGTIMNFLKKEDLKDLILDQEVVQIIISSRSDIAVLEDIAEMLKNNVNETFVKESLTWKSYAKRNSFYFLCKSKYFNETNFKILISLMQKYLNQNDTVMMIKECNDTMKNVLHVCVEMMNEQKLPIMWTEIQNVCNDLNPPLNIKDLVIQNESSVLHAATSNDNEDFHNALWKLVLQTYPETNELRNLVFQVNQDGLSFLHLLIKNKNFNILNCSLMNLTKIPFNDILKIKDNFGRNLLHMSICTCKNDKRIHQVLWNRFKTSKSQSEISEILTEEENEHNNIFQLLTRYSSSKVFTYIIQEVETMTTYEDKANILKNLNQLNQSLIQIAVINNFDLEFHEQLWKIFNKYLATSEILEIINSNDKFGNNILFSAVLYNKTNIVELTWNEIRKFICDKVKQNNYLNIKGQEEKSLLEVAQMNTRNHEVATWVDKLLKEFLPKEQTNDHPYGKSENLLQFEADNDIAINSQKLQQILEHLDVRDRKIVAFSVVGAFRKGKSLFLNYCLRFLYAHFSSINYPENPISNKDKWMGESNEPLIGFSWRSGSTRDTMGITIWNDVFLHTDENGDKIAVIVLDTQGLFDNDTSPQDNSRIFAIGTLISSIQVFNISMQVQEDQLQYLQFATDYAKFASNDSQQENGKCFQNLTFLIRDWPHPDEYDYGVEEGQKYLQNFLKIKDNQNKELKSVRKFIRNSFDTLDCFLLPPPGNNVAIGRRQGMKYDGNHGEMDSIFRTNLFAIIEYLFSAEKLIGKKINGKCLTGIDYFQYVEKYFEIFKSNDLPKTQSIYELTVEQTLSSVIKSCIEEYQKNIEKNQKIINRIEQIEIIHQLGKYQAMFKYSESNKMGNIEHHAKFKVILMTQIDDDFDSWSRELSKKITLEILEKQKKAEEKDTELSELELERENLRKEAKHFEVIIQQKDAEILSLNNTIKMINDKHFNEKQEQQQFQKSEAITVAIFDENNELKVQEELLMNMLLHPDVKNRKIVIFSVIGESSSGKSFFLNYCLRFLYYHYSSIKQPDNPTKNAEKWMGEGDEPLQGFSWRSGSARGTSGIVMWHDVFLYTTEDTGEKYAILVMDTQGLFDNETPENNSRIFALGTLFSSIQVLNLLSVVQEDQLQYLQFATEFAKFAAEYRSADKPFQNLVFLIRDWVYPEDHYYGTVGGQEYLQKVLEINGNQKEGLKSGCEHINGSFEKLSCSLLPHPGKTVSGKTKKGKVYNGSWNEMDEEFKNEFFKVIEHLLRKENLIPKKINGDYVIGANYLQYILQYFEFFQSGPIPKVQSIYESTVELQMNILVNECFNNYKETIYKNQQLVDNEGMIKGLHEMSKNKAILKFIQAKKMGNKDHELKFKIDLEKKIDTNYKEWESNAMESNAMESNEKINKEKERIQLDLEKKLRLKEEQLENEMRYQTKNKIFQRSFSGNKRNLILSHKLAAERKHGDDRK